MKKNVLFVGSFCSSKQKAFKGGQMFACTTLVESDLKEFVKFELVDTTASSNLSRPWYEVYYKSFKRLIKFLWILVTKEVESVIVFCSSGYSFIEKGLMLTIAHFFGKKTILAPRSGYIIDDIENSPVFKQLVILVISKASVIVCQSEFWQTYYSNISSKENNEKFRVVHNWLDLDKYLSIKHTNKEESDELVVLFIGWVNENKGVIDLFNTALELRNERVRFKVAGDGQSSDFIEGQIKLHNMSNNFELLGWVNEKEKISLLSSSDIFILPSYREGYPNSLIEAMSAELPIVCSRIPGTEGIIVDSHNGLFITPGNVDEMKKAIITLKMDRNLRLKLGKNARKTTIRNNRIEVATNRFKKILINI